MDKKKLRELAERSTRVVAWYPHSKHDGYHPGKASVRGPFGRWLLVEGGSNGLNDEGNHPTPVADLDDDANFAAAAMNNFVPLLDEVQRLESALEVAVGALEGFQLGHTHKETDEHYRSMGSTYGWCSHCSTKVCIDEDDARDALAKIKELTKDE